MLCGHAFADIVHLRDGSTVEGVVIEQNAREVVVEIKIGAITTKKRISIRDVDRIEYKPIAEAPEPDEDPEETKPKPDPEPELEPDFETEPEDELESTRPAPTPSERARGSLDRDTYVVIPITGRMGSKRTRPGSRTRWNARSGRKRPMSYSSSMRAVDTSTTLWIRSKSSSSTTTRSSSKRL